MAKGISIGTGTLNKNLKSGFIGTGTANKKLKKVLVGTASGNKVAWTSFEAFVYIVKKASSRNAVRKVSPNGETVWSSIYMNSMERGSIVVDAEGYLYPAINRSGYTYIYKISPSNSEVYSKSVQASNINSIAISKLGTFWITGGTGKNIYRVSSSGNVTTIINYNAAPYLAVDYEGNVYVKDYDAVAKKNIIKKRNDNGDIVSEINPEIDNLADIMFIALDEDKNIYITHNYWETYTWTMSKISANGTFIWGLGAIGKKYDRIVVDKDNVYGVTSSSEVCKLKTNGTLEWNWEPIEMGVFKAVDKEGFIYMAYNGGVKKLDKNRSEIWTYVSDEPTHATMDIAVDPGLLGAFPNEWQ